MKFFLLLTLYLSLFSFNLVVDAATLIVSPNTGVYTIGSTFTTRIVVNTEGKPINAAEGSIRFNPQELSVVSVDRSSSIFNLWVTEPTFSNSAGTVSFSGGLPSGYTGSAGNVFNITFKSLVAGTPRISYTSGAVLANDGKGTNVLSAMSGGTYTVQAKATQPIPEVIEYIPPANTPQIPKILMDSRGEAGSWSKEKDIQLTWQLPEGITAVRTSLDTSASTIPTKVYDNPISSISLTDLDEGVSYFHLQFKNSDGWGKILHYALKTDTQKPESITISLMTETELLNPVQTLKVEVVDRESDVSRYKVQIDKDEPYEYIDENLTGEIVLPELQPGYHAVVIEAFDQTNNSIIGTFNFNIESFAKPVFSDYPNEINEEVIPVIRGNTRPNSRVGIELTKVGSESIFYEVSSNAEGVFTFIPEGTFTLGVYELSAQATDEFGAKSEVSDKIRIAVQQPGYLKVGSKLISVLSVIIPLLAMTAVLIVGLWALLVYMRRFRGKVSVESKEAGVILLREFDLLNEELLNSQVTLAESKKTKKLSKTEEDIFSHLKASLGQAKTRVEKEIKDVENLVSKKSKVVSKKLYE